VRVITGEVVSLGCDNTLTWDKGKFCLISIDLIWENVCLDSSALMMARRAFSSVVLSFDANNSALSSRNCFCRVALHFLHAFHLARDDLPV